MGDRRDFDVSRKYREFVCGGTGNLTPEARAEMDLMREYLASGGRLTHPGGFEQFRNERRPAAGGSTEGERDA